MIFTSGLRGFTDTQQTTTHKPFNPSAISRQLSAISPLAESR